MPRGRVEIDIERCKGCGLCIQACPHDVLDFSGKLNSNGFDYAEPRNPDDCVGCAFCGMICPDVAITVFQKEAEEV
ncbi:MAG: ferredoxin family protein [Candidatus Acetothermia bacterium]